MKCKNSKVQLTSSLLIFYLLLLNFPASLNRQKNFEMESDRRQFLKKAGLAFASGLALNTPGVFSLPVKTNSPIKEFGIQLWSVREEMTKNPKGVLKDLASYGYKQIESFGDGPPEAMFWGMGSLNFKNYLNSIGLDLVSAHCDSDYTLNPKRSDEFKRLADDAAKINMKYLINPFMIQLKTIDAFKQAAEGFNKQGEICKQAGLKFAYHNHNYSFRKIGELFPQDVMMQNTDPSLVDFEIDIYWVVDAGQDPIYWLNKYPNRFRLCHIKDHYQDAITADLVKKEKPEEPELGLNVSCDLGKGKIDFAKILKAASAAGVRYFLVEQERYDGTTSMESAKNNAEYMKRLNI